MAKRKKFEDMFPRERVKKTVDVDVDAELHAKTAEVLKEKKVTWAEFVETSMRVFLAEQEGA